MGDLLSDTEAANSMRRVDIIPTFSTREDVSLEIEKRVRFNSLSNTRLELIILPTEQCNFRCTYCYEDFAIGGMSQTTINAVMSLIERRAPKLKILELSYFGGEPLLGMRAIKQISSKAISLSREYGFDLLSSATTNAYLLNGNNLNDLVGLGITTFQISLDGWQQVHDKTRRRKDGTGSFDKIWDNLISAKNTNLNFHFTLRIHLMPGNEESVIQLVRNVNQFLDDDRFVMMFKKVGEWGGKDEAHPEVYVDNSAALDELLAQIDSLAQRRTLDSVDELGGGSASSGERKLTEQTQDMPYVCYASMGNSLVIRANGRINKCTVALNSPRNDIGCINADGSLSIDSLKLGPWLGGLANIDVDYLGCPASKVLSG